jgi:group I intron endonuclease
MTSLPKVHRVYTVLCAATGKRYIGQTTYSVHLRWLGHLSLLRRGKHPNRFLQEDWNTHGCNAFTVHPVADYDDRAKADDKERALIGECREARIAYNMQSGGKAGYEHAEESLKRFSECMKGKQNSKGHKNRLGTTHSQETRDKISRNRKGQRWDGMEEHIARLASVRRGQRIGEKAHCKYGHVLPTSRRTDGRKKNCTMCAKRRQQEYKDRKKAALSDLWV